MKPKVLIAAALFAAISAYAQPQTWAWDDGTVPYVQTPMEIVERMMRMAEVGKGDYLIDLGSGDGRIVVEAAKRSQRAPLEGVECDVLCIGRFYDFWEKRKGRWGLVWRRLTYEKDQIVPVDPTKAPKLDPKLLARFPVGYRHLAYLQTKVGYKVKEDMPGVDGPATDALYALGANWLKGVSVKKIGW